MTPGRALYEFRRPGDPLPPIAWEELGADGREFYELMFQAGLSFVASPFLAAEQDRLLALGAEVARLLGADGSGAPGRGEHRRG